MNKIKWVGNSRVDIEIRGVQGETGVVQRIKEETPQERKESCPFSSPLSISEPTGATDWLTHFLIRKVSVENQMVEERSIISRLMTKSVLPIWNGK